ncbi:MAG: hypothetical protein E7105_00160 [Prevotella sp.]|jgi:hypothetical protein|nr:hypothetical protein [Prevotella sp.]
MTEKRLLTKEEIVGLLYVLHHSSFRNEVMIANSEVCGCFYCNSIFKPEEVTLWCDDDGKGARTALCPRCGIDSVLGNACGVKIVPNLLDLMHCQFFGGDLDEVLDRIKATKDEKKT